jgi:hypothetical protein
MLSGCLLGSGTTVALVNKSDLNSLSRLLLYPLCQLVDLCLVLGFGRGDEQASRLPRVSTAIWVLMPPLRLATSHSARSPLSTGRLHGAAVEQGCRRLGSASIQHSPQDPQVMDYRLEPALQLLIHRCPRHACSHYPAQPVKRFVQFIFSLSRIISNQNRIGSYKRPFTIPDSSRIVLFSHPVSLTYSKVHNTL